MDQRLRGLWWGTAILSLGAGGAQHHQREFVPVLRRAGMVRSAVGRLPDPQRYFIPRHGRWLSPDPIGKGAARLDDPQTWNMYVYSRNNPTTFNDPSGECGEWCQMMLNFFKGNGFETDSEVTSDIAYMLLGLGLRSPTGPSDENHALADLNPAVLVETSFKGEFPRQGGDIQYDLIKPQKDRQMYRISQAESFPQRSNDPSGISASPYPNQFLDEIRGGTSDEPNSIQTFFMTPIDQNGIPTGPPEPVNVKDLQGNTFYSLGVYMNQRDWRTYINGNMANSLSFLPPPPGITLF